MQQFLSQSETAVALVDASLFRLINSIDYSSKRF